MLLAISVAPEMAIPSAKVLNVRVRHLPALGPPSHETGPTSERREQSSFEQGEFEYEYVTIRFHRAVVVGVGRGLFRRALIAESNSDYLWLTSPPVLPLPDMVGRIQLAYCSRHQDIGWQSDSVDYWSMNSESIIRMAALSPLEL